MPIITQLNTQKDRNTQKESFILALKSRNPPQRDLLKFLDKQFSVFRATINTVSLCRLETKHGIDRWTVILIVERKTVNRVQPTCDPLFMHSLPSPFSLFHLSLKDPPRNPKKPKKIEQTFFPRDLAGNQRHSTFSGRGWLCLDSREIDAKRKEMETRVGEEERSERVLETRRVS